MVFCPPPLLGGQIGNKGGGVSFRIAFPCCEVDPQRPVLLLNLVTFKGNSSLLVRRCCCWPFAELSSTGLPNLQVPVKKYILWHWEFEIEIWKMFFKFPDLVFKLPLQGEGVTGIQFIFSIFQKTKLDNISASIFRFSRPPLSTDHPLPLFMGVINKPKRTFLGVLSYFRG